MAASEPLTEGTLYVTKCNNMMCSASLFQSFFYPKETGPHNSSVQVMHSFHSVDKKSPLKTP